jgi:hypothetical protein
MVFTNQSAFVRGRNIHENFLFVQQMVKSLHRKKEAHILLKLYIAKAFDSVSYGPFYWRLSGSWVLDGDGRIFYV